MKKASLLRSYIRRVIREASSPEDYLSLAAHVVRGENTASAFIYDPEVIKVIPPELSQEDLRAAFVPGLRGGIHISEPLAEDGNCNGAWEVTGSWVKNKGSDGRMVYGIAFAMSPTGILMPDRTSVSPSARGGWNRFAGKGYPSKSLDDRQHKKCGPEGLNTHTPDDSSDDCYVYGDPKHPYVDRTYQHPDREIWANVLKSMEANHEETMMQVSNGLPRIRKGMEIALMSSLTGEFSPL